MSNAAVLPTTSLLLSSGIARKVDDEINIVGRTYELDFFKLESYFQSLNKQLYDQKCDITNCVTEQMYRQELTLRLELSRKIDTCVGDVNLLRDHLYRDEGNSSSSSSYSKPDSKLALIRGELEGVKMVLRRLELQHAENLDLFSRLRAAETAIAAVASDLHDYRFGSDPLEPVRQELAEAMEAVEESIQAAQTDSNRRAEGIESKLSSLAEGIPHGLSDRLKQVEDKLQHLHDHGDYEPEDMDDIVMAAAIANTGCRMKGVLSDDEDDTAANNIRVTSSNNKAASHSRPSVIAATSNNNTVTATSPTRRSTRVTNNTNNAAAPIDMDSLTNHLSTIFASQETVAALQTDTALLQRQAALFQSRLLRMHGNTMRRVYDNHMQSSVIGQKQAAFDKIKHHAATLRFIQTQTLTRKMKLFVDSLQRLAVRKIKQRAVLRWRHVSRRLSLGQRWAKWLRSKMQHWMEKAQPDMLKYIEKWKAFVVDSYRSSMLCGDDDFNDNNNNNTGSNQMAIKKLSLTGKHFSMANLKNLAMEDMQARWSLDEKKRKAEEAAVAQQQAIFAQIKIWQAAEKDKENERQEASLKRLYEAEKEISSSRKELTRQLATLDENNKQTLLKVEAHGTKLTAALSSFKSQTALQLSVMKETIDEEQAKLESTLTANTSRIATLETSDKQRNTAQNSLVEVLERMRSRIMAIEEVAEDSHNEIATLTDSLHSLQEELQAFTNSNLLLQKRQTGLAESLQEAQSFYDEELRWVRAVQQEAAVKGTELNKRLEQHMTHTQGALEALLTEEGGSARYQSLLQSLSSAINRCLKYKQATSTLASNTAGLSAADKSKLEGYRRKVSSELGKCLKRAAAFVALKADEQVLSHAIKTRLLRSQGDGYSIEEKEHGVEMKEKVHLARLALLRQLGVEIRAMLPSPSDSHNQQQAAERMMERQLLAIVMACLDGLHGVIIAIDRSDSAAIIRSTPLSNDDGNEEKEEIIKPSQSLACRRPLQTGELTLRSANLGLGDTGKSNNKTRPASGNSTNANNTAFNGSVAARRRQLLLNQSHSQQSRLLATTNTTSSSNETVHERRVLTVPAAPVSSPAVTLTAQAAVTDDSSGSNGMSRKSASLSHLLTNTKSNNSHTNTFSALNYTNSSRDDKNKRSSSPPLPLQLQLHGVAEEGDAGSSSSSRFSSPVNGRNINHSNSRSSLRSPVVPTILAVVRSPKAGRLNSNSPTGSVSPFRDLDLDFQQAMTVMDSNNNHHDKEEGQRFEAMFDQLDYYQSLEEGGHDDHDHHHHHQQLAGTDLLHQIFSDTDGNHPYRHHHHHGQHGHSSGLVVLNKSIQAETVPYQQALADGLAMRFARDVTIISRHDEQLARRDLLDPSQHESANNGELDSLLLDSRRLVGSFKPLNNCQTQQMKGGNSNNQHK